MPLGTRIAVVFALLISPGPSLATYWLDANPDREPEMLPDRPDMLPPETLSDSEVELAFLCLSDEDLREAASFRKAHESASMLRLSATKGAFGPGWILFDRVLDHQGDIVLERAQAFTFDELGLAKVQRAEPGDLTEGDGIIIERLIFESYSGDLWHSVYRTFETRLPRSGWAQPRWGSEATLTKFSCVEVLMR